MSAGLTRPCGYTLPRRGESMILRTLLIVITLDAQGFAQSRSSINENVPDNWPKQDRLRYVALQNGFDRVTRTSPQRQAVAATAMIAGTSDAFAVHAGLGALKRGGNAADAALTASLAQISLEAGAFVSYAGLMTAVYYDAKTHRVYALNAAYNTLRNEKDPQTIPTAGHSGRTALVPGFMAGVEALHSRFGKLPFRMLFDPAIWVAEQGVPINVILGRTLALHKGTLTRLADTKRVFTKRDGQLFRTGDKFRQPELAHTLRNVASQGSAYMYKGLWAHRMVEAVQREGGKLNLEDLAAYRPLWSEPLNIAYGDYQVFTLGLPNRGGLETLASLKLVEVSRLNKYGHYTRSADALYYLIQISRLQSILASQPAAIKKFFDDGDHSPTSRLSTQSAERLWAQIQAPTRHELMDGLLTGPPQPGHSAGIVAVDNQGNVAAILHSLNGTAWGETGIFVDGVSIPDSARFQQQLISEAGPGRRLPEATNPLIVLREGRPILACTAIGTALHETTLENLINVLDFAMDPKTALDQPNTENPFYGIGVGLSPKFEMHHVAVGEGDFPASVLDGVRSRGQAIKTVPYGTNDAYWIGVQIDHQAHKLRGGVPSVFNAHVEGY